MTKRTNIIKLVANMESGNEFYMNPLNFSEKQINDLKRMVKDGVVEPINFIDRVTEEGARLLIKGDMLLPGMDFRKVGE